MKESRECGTQSQSNVREPGENPGRLRHCMEIRIPTAKSRLSHWSKDREGRSEVRLQVRIPVEMCSSWFVRECERINFSVKEKDEASLARLFARESVN